MFCNPDSPAYVSPNVGVVRGNNSPVCLSRIQDQGTKLSYLQRTGLMSLAETLPDEVASSNANYEATIDDGNTDMLIASLSLMTSLDAQDELLDISPWVSETTLRWAAEENIMSTEMFEEVLIANPDVLRNNKFLTDMEAMGYSGERLRAVAGTITARTEAEEQLQSYHAQLGSAYALLAADCKSDEDYVNLSDWLTLLENQNTPQATYELVSYYDVLGDHVTADNLFESMPETFEMEEDVLDIHAAYSTLRSILEALIDEQEGVLTPEQVTTLTGVAGDVTGTGAAHGIDVLLNDLGYVPRVPCGPYLAPLRMAQYQTDQKRTMKELSVYPNPGKDHVVFGYNLEDATGNLTLLIKDVSGKLIQQMRMEGNRGLVHWYTSNIPNGMYFYRVTDGKRQYGNGKVVIMK